MGTFFVVFGGVGLFLLGMMIMTDGLKSLAGNSLKRLLSKFTGGTFSSIVSGASITAVIQSSSATSLMTIGFVSAGLLSFSQAVGVIIGANLGSTSTGWIVSAIGFKVSMGALALPLVGAGAFLRLFSNGRYTHYGIALAGLGLIFLAIGLLQEGMSDLAASFSLHFLGSPSILQLLLLVIIGLVMTVVMQSSSAAFVITLTALVADTISFEQAAALVIGQNVGTTVKAYIASIGGTAPARRTALAHIGFNLFTALVSLLLFPWLIPGVLKLGDVLNFHDYAILLSLLNTLMYLISVIVIVPLLTPFMKVIERIVPDRSRQLIKYLDPTVATIPAVAIEAVRRTLIKIMKELSVASTTLFMKKQYTNDIKNQLFVAKDALNEAQKFLALINNESSGATSREYQQQVALVHSIDHLLRFIKVMEEEEAARFLNNHTQMQELLQKMILLFELVPQQLTYEDTLDVMTHAEQTSKMIAELRRENRKDIFEKTVMKNVDLDVAIQDVHTLHWFDRVAYHMWRGLYHIHVCTSEESTPVEELH